MRIPSSIVIVPLAAAFSAVLRPPLPPLLLLLPAYGFAPPASSPPPASIPTGRYGAPPRRTAAGTRIVPPPSAAASSPSRIDGDDVDVDVAVVAEPNPSPAPGGTGGTSTTATVVDRRCALRSASSYLLALSAAAAAAACAGTLTPGSAAVAETVRAVGSAERSCREAGDCLRRFDIDGAVGWNWGGRDRCDASDPRCGAGGRLRDVAPGGEDVPGGMGLRVTDVVEMEIGVGRQEMLTMRMGLYGDACPGGVGQFLDFVSSDPRGGIDLISKKLLAEDGFYAFSVPVNFNRGGALNVVYPESRLDFGVPSQTNAYARGKGLSRAEGFAPQPRPDRTDVPSEPSPRDHGSAGLLSVPRGGIGYGGPGFGADDEAYMSAFQITAAPVPSMDREGRRVIGQILDGESMAALARLAALPTRKGFKGVIPGQNAGPPLLKVTVNRVSSRPVATTDVPKEGSS